MNYLIDEAMETGKGANTVVSLLHHFLAHHAVGEVELRLHADNCSGQNKNNTVLQYLAWRVLSGLHRCVTMSFMLVGHTKFSPDWCFGLLKQKFRRTFVSSLQDLVEVVNSSAQVNCAQLVGSDDGEVIVPTYDWSGFLSEHFCKVPQLKSYHHFQFSTALPGVVLLKKFSDSDSSRFRILTDNEWVPSPHTLPPVIRPAGLSLPRKWYLYNSIREYCRPGTEDLVCPLPLDPPPTRDGTSAGSGTPTRDDSADTHDGPTRDGTCDGSGGPTRNSTGSGGDNGPPSKRARRCGACGEEGHTRRTCGKYM